MAVHRTDSGFQEVEITEAGPYGIAGANQPAIRVQNGVAAIPAIQVVQSANASASTSVGGAVNIDNSLSTGAGLVVFTSQSAPSGRLVVVRSTSATFNQTALHVDVVGSGAGINVTQTGTGAGIITNAPGTAGTSHALSAVLAGTGGTLASAGNFVSSNQAASCVQITGTETGRGSLKISHQGDLAVADDANGSCLSLDIKATGTAGNTNAQGIFIDATLGGTNGKLINARNNGNLNFQVRSATASDRVSATAYVTPVIELGSTSIQVTCGAGSPESVVTAPTGSLYLRQGGGAAATLYVKETGVGNTGWIAK